ncbi:MULTISPECIES: Fur family transcriptional regulator [unclassified Agarivorans]|uniref:Fur family transcriptional regulator n=1 Tax=unclassified Agarivorans TaxID=2636026 RepID=UPI0026E2C81D|nr:MULTISPECIES: Fur family transcriptional regulator [unclassified Agarivorans]MDO6684548.1 Fur family transcriptional regulator [Agarivorans sp. 3_MG-2023]MDO6714713.1 Fur family transcriptional regulator [Agarivorans sp. 2_MG-2023]
MITANYIQRVSDYCHQQKLKLTPNRAAVLAILHKQNAPLSAYDVLAELQQQQPKTKPPTVYRALEFLIQHHFIQHIESTSRYLVSQQQESFAPHPLLICTDCKSVTQMNLSNELKLELDHFAGQQGFSLHPQSYEFQGLCANCQPRKSA